MRILHIAPTYFPACHQGGPISSVHYLNKWLVKKGVDVTVYTTNIDGLGVLDVALNRLIDIDGVKVYYFPATFRPWQYSYSLHRALKKNLRNFDAVHITSTFLAASTLGAYYSKKFNKPYIISPRGNLMKEPLSGGLLKKKIYLFLIEKRNLAAASLIHFTVEAEKDEYLKAGLPLKKGVVIPNGLDLEEFSKRPPLKFFRKKFKIGDNKKIVLFMGRLSWIKGFDALIPAFAEVIKKNPDTVLALVGGDEKGHKKNVEFLISNFKLKDKVMFTDILTGEDKIAAFQESDIFVLPSYSESFGMAALEAMYFGLPVVITKNVGISPSVEKVSAGIVVEKDERQLSGAILRILQNLELGKEMGERGKRLVEEEFSCQSVAERFIKAYNELI
ncbi:MAG: glycosyltransferase [Patescibacteria group bacterium]